MPFAMEQEKSPHQLRILVANTRPAELEHLAALAAEIGDEVVARELELAQVARVADELRPDVAVVGLSDENPTHALDMVRELVRGGVCPVVATLEHASRDMVEEAAARGVFAYASPVGAEELRGAIDVAVRRFLEYEELEGAMARRAVIERAKGLLMERHSLDERRAFEMLRGHARESGQRVPDVAEAVLSTRGLGREG